MLDPTFIFRGRLILQGIVLTDYAFDLQREANEYSESDKTTRDSAEVIASVAWHTGMMGLETILVWSPLVKPYAVGKAGTVLATRGATAAGAAITATAPISAGVAIGAVVGTAVSQELFGDEGAQTALGFYSLGLLPGTEAPELSTYGNLLRPSETEVKGPVEYVNTAIRTGKTIVNTWWNRRPRMFWGPRF